MTEPIAQTPPGAATDSPEVENQHHTYVTNRIPWLVHAMWLGFWILCIAYLILYQFPAFRTEILSPP
jgi:hypothetical protein